jgi:hypothetical protein
MKLLFSTPLLSNAFVLQEKLLWEHTQSLTLSFGQLQEAGEVLDKFDVLQEVSDLTFTELNLYLDPLMARTCRMKDVITQPDFGTNVFRFQTYHLSELKTLLERIPLDNLRAVTVLFHEVEKPVDVLFYVADQLQLEDVAWYFGFLQDGDSTFDHLQKI